MEPSSIKFETIFDDINSLKAEKSRLEERLKVVRFERTRKQAAGAALLRKRQGVANLVVRRGESLKLIQHRVKQQEAQLTSLRRDVAEKAETVKQCSAEV